MVSSADVELENGVGLNGQEHTRAVVCSYCLSFFFSHNEGKYRYVTGNGT